MFCNLGSHYRTRHTIKTIAPLVVEKCFGATRVGTKNAALEVLMLYIEVDTSDVVVVSPTL